MFCIIEIHTVIKDDFEDQTIGRSFGPFEDAIDAADSAHDLAEFACRDYPGYEVSEVDTESLEGDDNFECGFVVEKGESIKSMFLVKSLLAVAIPEIS